MCVCVCVCVCVYVCVYVCVCVCMCMYNIIHGPLLGICAIYHLLLVDLPLCKRDFSRPTFVYKPGRNIIPALSQKINIRALV